MLPTLKSKQEVCNQLKETLTQQKYHNRKFDELTAEVDVISEMSGQSTAVFRNHDQYLSSVLGIVKNTQLGLALQTPRDTEAKLQKQYD